MTTVDRIQRLREFVAGERGPYTAIAEDIAALIAHGDAVAIPDFETSVRMVAAHMHGMGRFYCEIAVDPETKEVAWTFEPTERDESHDN
jgi:hypothetical protein